MGMQNKNTKNSITSKNNPKSKTLRELEKVDIDDWYIVIKLNVPCSGRKSTSEKMSVYSIQSYPLQLTLKLSLVRLWKYREIHYNIG